ncbi:3729_t:CDS:2 [Racocetra persica]|uniref:3729_t:CDS:1 n=1 Tax=Racocetra persica TaxID=160502 RepID=A0ACA9MKQ2_9GLOM|nr:3729_t:CDS:2 [Racocetra persica]
MTAKSAPILEKPPNALSDSSEISQNLLNFGNQSSTSTYSSPNHQENQSKASFAPEFIKYFTIPEQHYRWQIDLNLLTQQENEKNIYHSLKGKIAAFMSIAEPKTLNDAIENARK